MHKGLSLIFLPHHLLFHSTIYLLMYLLSVFLYYSVNSMRAGHEFFPLTFYYENSQTYRKLEELCNEHPYTHHLDSIINIYCICLIKYLFIPLFSHQSILFFTHFDINCKHQYISLLVFQCAYH